MIPRRIAAAFVVLGLTALACGSSDSKGPTLIEVEQCSETFDSCVGSELGTWELTGVCATDDIADFYNAQALSDAPSCANAFTSATLSSAGNVTYDGAKFSRKITYHTVGKLKITAACVAERMQGLVLTSLSCTNLALALPSQFPNTTFKCSYDGTNCNCDMSGSEDVNDSGEYTADNGRIIESGGVYGYCVVGDTMTQSTTFPRSGVSGIAHLTKK